MRCSTRCTVGSRDRSPTLVAGELTRPARSEFCVFLPLDGRVVPPLIELEDATLGLPLWVSLGEILFSGL